MEALHQKESAAAAGQEDGTPRGGPSLELQLASDCCMTQLLDPDMAEDAVRVRGPWVSCHCQSLGNPDDCALSCL